MSWDLFLSIFISYFGLCGKGGGQKSSIFPHGGNGIK